MVFVFNQKNEERSIMNKIKVTLPDNSILEFDSGVQAGEVVRTIGEGLYKAALAVKIDGKKYDLSTTITTDCAIEVLTFKNDEGKDIYWHSSSHVMAQAVKELFPETKVAIGPSIETGFYYDFDREKAFTQEDLEKIEKKIEELVKANHSFERKEVDRDEAIKFFEKEGEIYKVEILKELPEGETISMYTQGSFIDLCRGPHVENTGKLGVFKLLNVAGAYWRGDSSKKMLQRIYAISFPSKKELKQYITMREEAALRDHRKIGKDLGLFTINEQVGPGLVLWLPKGAVIRDVIESFWKKEHRKAGYVLVNTPHVGKASLWETSGHLSFYKDGMYAGMDVEGQMYYVKPMNCPFHIMIYKNELHSYRDLPMKMAEMGTVYRYEPSGTLHGLLRVRGFTQDDAHIICMPEQLETEVEKLLDFSFYMLRTFGFENFEVYLSTMPEKSVGEPERWEQATESLRKAMEKHNIDYKVDEGGGAFYGPKIDIKIKDALSRSWQCTTIQFDFNLPERFDVTYIGEDGNEHRPYIIHRALLGSLERFFGTLVEHYAGNFPVWLAPIQVKVLPLTDRNQDYAKEIYQKLIEKDIRVEMDLRSEKIGKKIREAETQKVPFMLVVGDKEEENKEVALREHKVGDRGTMNFDDFLGMLQEKIGNHK